MARVAVSGRVAKANRVVKASRATVNQIHNLLTAAQDFTNAAWTAASCTVTANATTAPDGTSTAEQLEEQAGVAIHQIYQTVSLGTLVYNTNDPFTLSCFLKAGTRNFAALFLDFSSGTDALAYFNLGTGAVGSVSANASRAISPVLGLSAGWYRCSLTVTPTSSQGAPQFAQIMMSDVDYGVGIVPNYLGVVGQTLFGWGAQLTRANRPGEYVNSVRNTPLRNTP